MRKTGQVKWIWGSPVGPLDVLQDEFSGILSDGIIEQVADELSEINYEWSPRPGPHDIYEDLWVPTDPEGPHMEAIAALGTILVASKIERSATDGELIHRLLYLNVIIALEAYLKDSFSTLIFTRRPYLEQFVKHSPKFREQQISLADIFDRFRAIETQVQGFVSTVSWHDLTRTAQLYKQAFSVALPDVPDIIQTGIRDRHDIVHRNGKRTDGQQGSWNKAQIDALRTAVAAFITEVESLLTQIPEEPPAREKR